MNENFWNIKKKQCRVYYLNLLFITNESLNLFTPSFWSFRFIYNLYKIRIFPCTSSIESVQIIFSCIETINTRMLTINISINLNRFINDDTNTYYFILRFIMNELSNLFTRSEVLFSFIKLQLRHFYDLWIV